MMMNTESSIFQTRFYETKTTFRNSGFYANTNTANHIVLEEVTSKPS